MRLSCRRRKKHRHATRELALRHLHSLLASPICYGADTLTIYLCRCRYWHVGHRREKRTPHGRRIESSFKQEEMSDGTSGIERAAA
jgi:hypothetical protein